MDDFPRQKLRAIVSAHGRAVCKDPERVGALLAKVCPDHPREVQALYYALDFFLVDQALDDLGTRPWKSVAEPVIGDLVAKRSMSQEDADWATTSWGVALGEISADQGISPAELSAPDGEGSSRAGSLDDAIQTGRPKQEPHSQESPEAVGLYEASGVKSSKPIHPSAPSSSLRNIGVLFGVCIGGLILIYVFLSSLGGFRGTLFLDQPASYWSQKLKEPVVRKEVQQGRMRIMKDVDPAADLAQPEAVPILIELLQDESPIVRQKTVTVLGKIGSPAKAAIPALQQAAKDPDGEVRSRAVEALEKLESAGN